MNQRNQQLLDTYRKSLAHPHPGFEAIVEAFLEKVKGEPTMADVRSWVRRKGYKASTMKKEYSVLRRLFIVNRLEWESKRGDAPAISEKDSIADRLDPAIIREMIQMARGKRTSFSFEPTLAHRAYLALSTMYGLRRSEMTRVIPKSIDTKSSLIYIESEKHSRDRWHYVPPEIMPVLLAWGFDIRLTDWQASALFIDWREMAGVELPPDQKRLGWHSIRGTLTYELQDAGLSRPDVSRFMRWRRRDDDMQDRYASMRVIGRGESTRVLSVDEKKADLKVMEVHPFLKDWSE